MSLVNDIDHGLAANRRVFQLLNDFPDGVNASVIRSVDFVNSHIRGPQDRAGNGTGQCSLAASTVAVDNMGVGYTGGLLGKVGPESFNSGIVTYDFIKGSRAVGLIKGHIK